MKFRTLLIALALMLLVALLAAPGADVRAQDDTPPEPTPVSFEVVNEYFSVATFTTRDGDSITASRINGPSEPPDLTAWEASRATFLDRAAVLLPNFPSYSWVYGCSAVSGAMIAAYYDNNGYANIYTGPANSGVMPLTEDSSWGTWSDGDKSYPNNPLIASHLGVDGLAVRGSIDDYWVSYGSTANDPYITGGWTQHTLKTAIGDYMLTSQSAYGNVDGNTTFYNYSNGAKLNCSTMEDNHLPDGNLGRKNFYEARGYTVTECYNQYIDPYISGGFSLANFQAEINAGHPVLINLEGHTVVGFGYNGSTIYIRDTWDSDIVSAPHAMTWGGYYEYMRMISVSIVHLAEPTYDFSKSNPSNSALGLNPDAITLSWGESLGALSYEYCFNTSATCSTWTNVGTNRSVSVSSLADAETYYWQVRAVGSTATTYANGSEGAFWFFTTFDSALMTEKGFLPVMTR